MDPEMFDIIEREKKRQQESIDLIPSEVKLDFIRIVSFTVLKKLI
jgi:glycine/serine hydroxymethyltransferase